MRLGCRFCHRIESVHSIRESEFEREAELDAFFDTDIACAELVVGCSEHCLEGGRTVVPAEFKGVMGIIAHHESASSDRLVDIGTEVCRLGPVRLPVTELEVHFVIAQRILVICPVEIGENLVIAFSVDGVAEVRSKNTEHHLSVKAFGLVHAAHVSAEPEGLESIVFVVGGSLSLNVALESEVVFGSKRGCGKCDREGDRCLEKFRFHAFSLKCEQNLLKTAAI